MKVRIRVRRLRWVEYCLWLLGIAAIGYCAFVIIQAKFFQDRRSQELDRALHTEAPAPAPAPEPPKPARPEPGTSIGRLEIPRIGLSAMVLEGSDDDTLRLAVGHLSNTALPGEPGNVVFAGHRDTFFRLLRGVQKKT